VEEIKQLTSKFRKIALDPKSNTCTIFCSPPATISFPSCRNDPEYATSLNRDIDRFNVFVTEL
jgi:hypothetical protein